VGGAPLGLTDLLVPSPAWRAGEVGAGAAGGRRGQLPRSARLHGFERTVPVRIIAGSAKGRRLVSPPGGDTRPLTGRAKEALFSSLGERVVNADVVDLYAGTGSIGLEALSRGARRVVFVEKGRAALNSLGRNIESVGLGGEVYREDVAAFLARSRDAFDLAFVDPPYSVPLASLGTVLERLAPRLSNGATVVVHRRYGGEPLAAPPGLVATDRRRYGDTELWRFEKENA